MIATMRLLIRPWRDADRAPFAAMSGDPEVMRYLGPLHDRAGADAAIDRAISHQAANGFCFWALERRDDGEFLGFCGLKRVDVVSPIAGDAEIGWRLRRDAWGGGYAREAATAVLAWGFDAGNLTRIVAMTSAENLRSWGLMKRLDMVRRPELDFDHPALAVGDPLRPHIVYSIDAP